MHIANLKINLIFRTGAHMYVCLCKGVSNRTIRRCVGEGASSVAEIGRACGAGTVCGACKPDIEVLIRGESRRAIDTPGAEVLAAK